MSAATFAGKRVLVVGGEPALGRALAIELAEAGADIAIASLTAGREAEFAVNSALNELWAIGRQGLALVIDASDAAQLQTAVERCERELGRLDLAAVVTDESASVALPSLEETLPERAVVTIESEATSKEALRSLTERL